MMDQSYDRFFGNASRWRERASTMRALAEAAQDQLAKEKLVSAAEQYDLLAKRADEQRRSGEGSNSRPPLRWALVAELTCHQRIDLSCSRHRLASFGASSSRKPRRRCSCRRHLILPLAPLLVLLPLLGVVLRNVLDPLWDGPRARAQRRTKSRLRAVLCRSHRSGRISANCLWRARRPLQSNARRHCGGLDSGGNSGSSGVAALSPRNEGPLSVCSAALPASRKWLSPSASSRSEFTPAIMDSTTRI
jgi:hypothetical protein